MRALDWQKIAMIYVRIALAVAFLSAVGSRFGMYGKAVGWGNFANFTKYTAEVNSFMPAWTIPYIAWIATAAEVFFALALLAGLWPLWTALGTAVLLAIFGTAMAISFGIKSPLDYSVFSASAAAFLLAMNSSSRSRTGEARLNRHPSHRSSDARSAVSHQSSVIVSEVKRKPNAVEGPQAGGYVMRLLEEFPPQLVALR
jgi:uncharacterized membrane protein YphA (DoxX/SURF4 family)